MDHQNLAKQADLHHVPALRELQLELELELGLEVGYVQLGDYLAGAQTGSNQNQSNQMMSRYSYPS